MWTVLALFDIDGTLMRGASVEHAASLLAALQRVHHIRIPEAHLDAAGRTDGEIARQLLMLAGVSSERIDACASRVRAVCCQEFAHRCPRDMTDKVAAGVPELLEGLAQRGDVRLALVTGNLEPVARMKLSRAGLGHFFPRGQGGFGSDHEDRTALPRLARRRAGEPHRPYPRERTVVIGDTPRDILCARADGVHVVAVATGPYRPEQLTGADVVVSRAAEIPAALDALFSRDGRPAAAPAPAYDASVQKPS